MMTENDHCPTCGSTDKAERLDVANEDNIFDYPCTNPWHDVVADSVESRIGAGRGTRLQISLTGK